MNIIVNLLTNKNTYVLSDDLATEYSTNERGYKVIQGEDNATTITVNYPTSYAVFDKQVEMINAKGQQTIIELTGSEFTLPNTMTYAGNTTLVFSAVADDIKVVWQKVIIPITSTGVDFTNIALANPDILGEAIEASKYYAKFKEDVEAGKFNGTDGIDGIDGLGGNLTILNNDEIELEVGKKYVVEVAGVAENGLVTAKLVEEEEVENAFEIVTTENITSRLNYENFLKQLNDMEDCYKFDVYMKNEYRSFNFTFFQTYLEKEDPSTIISFTIAYNNDSLVSSSNLFAISGLGAYQDGSGYGYFAPTTVIYGSITFPQLLALGWNATAYCYKKLKEE